VYAIQEESCGIEMVTLTSMWLLTDPQILDGPEMRSLKTI